MKNIFLGKNPVYQNTGKVEGRRVVLDGREFYCISNSGQLRPFFLSVVSSADHWMYISSNGGLTAGRGDPNGALFPYYTDDKIHDSPEISGPKTILLVTLKGSTFLWEPFSVREVGAYSIRRNLHKSFHGDEILFEECNDDLGATFRYRWAASERYGWIRRASLKTNARIKVRILDGLQNLLPCGITSQFQLEKSTLVDAYKKNELLSDCGLGLFMLSSLPVDRPEPAESLRATTVWSAGLPRKNILLSAVQLEAFRNGGELTTETDIRAERGAYFVESEFTLAANGSRAWMMAAEVNQGPSQVADIRHKLKNPEHLQREVIADIAKGAQELWRLVAQADGLQKTSRALGDARHFNNVLFNIMRGGIFAEGYQIEVSDLRAFVQQANGALAKRHAKFFQKLGKTISRRILAARIDTLGDPNLERLCLEYLPLTFSRRHGDPSRPWNRFSIGSRNEQGRRQLNYEGNWRDIFQNWEALAVSFPGFVAGMIAKFVNASTADGYNPYRVTKAGFDWERHDPEDPWSHIGYWGDHQIIYLLKLLEILERHDPRMLREFLTKDVFSFANVPYRIKGYDDLLKNPRDTVEFDAALDRQLSELVEKIGADGKLLIDKSGHVLHVNLTEKLLVPILAKFANFVPGGGIWLNTQRPEWNDANNALVGSGLSMVTVYQLYRHLQLCRDLFNSLEVDSVNLSREFAEWLTRTITVLKKCDASNLDGIGQRTILDKLGRAAEAFRARLYKAGFSAQKSPVTKHDLVEFCKVALAALEKTIAANERTDGLFHSYNLFSLDARGGITLRRLPEMLEGQAAVLSAGILSETASLRVLNTLKHSALYRADQNSYLLYPDRQLPRFTEKNNLPPAAVEQNRLMKQLVADGDRRLLERDSTGKYHFHPKITNARDLSAILEQLAADGYDALVKRDSRQVHAMFEKMFDHASFTGRSGAFFGYEGLGCIYWHMVSKLLLSAQESFLRAVTTSHDRPAMAKLAKSYRAIRAGIGDYKTPVNYGAFPMDPYSHTPGHAGARQPGLTGQVKEDILCRFGELGVSVLNGMLNFQPRLLQPAEFLSQPSDFEYLDVKNLTRTIKLSRGSLAFTYCQVPVVYHLGKESFLKVYLADGKSITQERRSLDETLSQTIFERLGRIKQITCGLTHLELQ